MAVDLSVALKTSRGTLTLKNPIMPGSSELAVDEGTVKRCIDNNVGAVVTKSIFKTLPGMITTLSRPWAFPLEKFGAEYKGAWILQPGCPNPEDSPEKIMEKRLPKWKRIQTVPVDRCESETPVRGLVGRSAARRITKASVPALRSAA